MRYRDSNNSFPRDEMTLHSLDMNSQSAQRLQDIFRVVFGVPASFDVTKLDHSNAPRWDSLDHVSLVAAIESEFGVSLDAADQMRMGSYEATALLLEEKGV